MATVKKKKLRKLSAIKKQAWQLFSEFTRRKWANSSGNVMCISCNTIIPWKEANASHLYHGHSKKSFMMEENVSPSCVRCNMYLSGNLGDYMLWALKKYGAEKVEEIRLASKQIWKPTRQELEDIIGRYKRNLEAIHDAS